MRKLVLIHFCLLSILSTYCSQDKSKTNEINLSQSTTDHSTSEAQNQQSVKSLPIKPNTVLLTGINNHRLVTLYKEKVSKDGKSRYVDGNYYHRSYEDEYEQPAGNAWHSHYMPGFEAVYGYNMYNIAHYDISQNKKQLLFTKPVLINTLYYPSYLQDTLSNTPVKREYYMVSVYDEDTNNDSIINIHDLRRFYHFTGDALKKAPLIPLNYSVTSSEYDPQNDIMYVFARLDENANGRIEIEEHTHIFLLQLKSPAIGTRLY